MPSLSTNQHSVILPSIYVIISEMFVLVSLQKANYVGSLTQSSTVCLGTGPDGDVYIPLKDLLPMVHPSDIIFDGK